MVHPKPQEVRYDYVRHLREEFASLERELKEKGVEEGLLGVARRFNMPREMALAAVHRAAKRNGYTMRVFLEQLGQQLKADRRAAQGIATSPPGGAAEPGAGAPKGGRA